MTADVMINTMGKEAIYTRRVMKSDRETLVEGSTMRGGLRSGMTEKTTFSKIKSDMDRGPRAISCLKLFCLRNMSARRQVIL